MQQLRKGAGALLRGEQQGMCKPRPWHFRPARGCRP